MPKRFIGFAFANADFLIEVDDAGKVSFAMDDFGAGAASLHYLHALPVDFVKFDGSLTAKMGRSERDDILLRGMVKLCKELGLKTVAECIETEDQLFLARKLGFDLGQGYYFGRANRKRVPASHIGRNMKRQGVQEEWQ